VPAPKSFRRRCLTGVAAAALALGVAAPTVAAAAPAPSTAKPSTALLSTAMPGAAMPGAAEPAAAAQSSAQAARWGAGWLADQITANGGYLTSFGVADQSDTAYAVVGMYAAHVGRTASAQAIGYLKTQLDVALQDSDGNDSPGTLGYYILAAVSAGQDPRHFGGTAAQNDLVARLLATSRTSGPDAGLFGSADPTYDGAFRQGVALAALHAAGVPQSRSAVARGIHWLIGQQCANGLWQSYRADTSVPCPAADPNTFAGPDTNSTGMAVQGLAAYHRHPRRSATLASLHAAQSDDGGFAYLAAPGQSSDPDSTALTIQALLATGSPLATWRKGTGNPMSALLSYQLGCSDPAADRGAFYFPGDRSPNVIATVQAVPAAARLPLSQVHRGVASAAVPHPACASNNTAAVAPKPAVAPKVALAGTAGHCPGSTGVTVFVDFTAFGQGTQTRCAPGTPSTGIDALTQAGFTPAGTTKYGLAFVCRINNLPSTAQQACVTTPPATAYWAYYHANAGATTWSYSSSGPSSYHPAQGSIEGWAFGNGATPSKTPTQVRAS
jgi:hypothetical protein